ncbi:MoaD/ThiS family protein [Corticibacter populi]|uniref:MoaD/ThiS family protein n=1 Tax=Corticibacter populi TaxID=1550736 RepID=A0A3M6QIY7_9BURK|nr:MoaD/ThiS family protein [Corticibacter populi]RMX03046.1 MoaD/ThiS family protein [Corticibacter populi]RZS33483.1 molybdopterin synthase subunit MoaD [Corticibacter populi]
MITITYFGPLKQLQPAGTETLDWPGGSTEELLAQLRQRGPDWAEALQPGRIFKLALNQQLLHAPALVRDGDAVAILPPVTGG